MHKNGPGVPGAILGSVLACTQKPAQKWPLNTYGFFLAPQRAALGPKVAYQSSAHQPAWPCAAFGKARAPTLAIFVAHGAAIRSAVRVLYRYGVVARCGAAYSGAAWCHTDTPISTRLNTSLLYIYIILLLWSLV